MTTFSGKTVIQKAKKITVKVKVTKLKDSDVGYERFRFFLGSENQYMRHLFFLTKTQKNLFQNFDAILFYKLQIDFQSEPMTVYKKQ